MADKTAIVDYWTLAKNFARGDVVYRRNLIDGDASTVTGTVTAVLHGIGFVDVEFPWGNERVSAEELVIANPNYIRTVPPQYDTSYRGWDIDQSHIEDGTAAGYSYAWPKKASATPLQDRADHLAAHYISDMSRLEAMAQQCAFHGLNEMDSYRAIGRVSNAPDHQVRQAIYWVAPGRRYRMNRRELDDGLPDCPKCGANLQKTNYKKHTKLFVCPECLFCIKPYDIEGLPGYVEEAGFGVSPDQEVDLLTAALKTARAEVRNAAWDTLKKQVLKYLKREHPQFEAYHKGVAADIVGRHTADMFIHEDELPARQLKKEADEALFEQVRESLVGHGLPWRVQGSLGDKIRDAVMAKKDDFHYPDEAVEGIFGYVTDLPLKDLLEVDDKEIGRLIGVQKEIDAERHARYAVGFQQVIAARNPSVIELRELIGSEGMDLLYEEVRDGSKSPILTEQFHYDLENHGYGDALFLLSANTADGLFDREAYNRLVDVLDYVRGPDTKKAWGPGGRGPGRRRKNVIEFRIEGHPFSATNGPNGHEVESDNLFSGLELESFLESIGEDPNIVPGPIRRRRGPRWRFKGVPFAARWERGSADGWVIYAENYLEDDELTDLIRSS